MEEIRLWRLVKGATGMHVAEPIKATEQTTTEKLLEEMLTSSPELLMDGLAIVGRQNETQTGPLDLLGVDEEGQLVVFELKRSTLTREAVAQALDYAPILPIFRTTASISMSPQTQASMVFLKSRISGFGTKVSSQRLCRILVNRG